jgi:hypothetical protein
MDRTAPNHPPEPREKRITLGVGDRVWARYASGAWAAMSRPPVRFTQTVQCVGREAFATANGVVVHWDGSGWGRLGLVSIASLPVLGGCVVLRNVVGPRALDRHGDRSARGRTHRHDRHRRRGRRSVLRHALRRAARHVHDYHTMDRHPRAPAGVHRVSGGSGRAARFAIVASDVPSKR